MYIPILSTCRTTFIMAALAAVSHIHSLGAIETAPESDTEIWNRGVELYRAGNHTNALAVLKPLILSKTHGVRASEIVGAIEYAESLKRDGDGVAKPLANLESAASGFQSALRSNPLDPRMNRNFTRCVDRLPELREQAHVEKVMKELGKQDPSGILGSGVKDVRKLLKDFPASLTNDARRTVAACDAMAKRMEKLCDTWIAVKASVAQSVTNEQQAMTINAQVEEARLATESAHTAIADINPEALAHLAKAENSFTRFWKMSILPPAACDESMLSQTNELLKIENEYGRDWQEEALEFTQMFRAKFPAWAQAYEQQAQTDTNKPPFTKEAQAEICTLAEEVEKLQTELESDKKSIARKDGRKGGGKPAEHAAKQFDALKKLARIKELLPKDGGNGGGQNQQQNQNNQQNQDQKQDQKQNQDQNQNNQQQQDQDQNNQQEQDQQSEKKEQKEKQSSSEEKDDKKDEQVEDILRRAKERSDQHEADKKARMNKAPLPSNERDW